MKLKENGFTLIELVIVIVILGILSAVAIPQFVNLRDEASLGNEAAVAGGVQSGILTYFIDAARGGRSTYPATLDALPDGTVCSGTNPCFTTVLAQGGISDQWTKLTSVTYRSSSSATNVWIYDPVTGIFTKTVI